MSDHWNLLADLLGTPNLGNRSKKSAKSEPAEPPTKPIESAEKPKLEPAKTQQPSPTKAQDDRREDQPPAALAEPAKERSLIQNSWDALANLFGIANEPPAEVRPETIEAKTETKTISATEKPTKSKRPASSMWGSPSEQSLDPQEAPKGKSQHSDATALPSFSNADAEPADSVPQGDRRGPRRSPRRGKTEFADTNSNPRNAETSQPTRQAEDDLPNRPEDRSEIRSERRTDNRSTRNSGRGDSGRQERGDSRDSSRRESSHDRNRRRPLNDDPAQEQERSDRRTPATRESRSRDFAQSDRLDQPAREPRGFRDQDRTSRSPQQDPTRKRPSSGFAAGISDEITDEDLAPEFGSESSQNPQSHDEESSRSPRRKKRRSRPREQSDVTSDDLIDSADSDRSSESSESRPRHGKIPTWTETIGFVIQANVANHQKQSSSGRGRPRRPNH